MENFTSGKELLELCESRSLSVAQAMILRETALFGTSEEEIYHRIAFSYSIMKTAVYDSLNQPIETMGGLIGGEAAKINSLRLRGKNLCGAVVSKAVAYAMGVLEVNASMGLIVAAPTAGSSGVIPGVFLALQEEFDLTDQQMYDGLFCAGAIGYLIAHNATVAGAEGGCQAEIGAASAMAAAAVVQMMGGSCKQSLDAASSAIANILGLVCDPIGGLVEAPCQTRNAMGASNALICGEITLAGVGSLIPFDEMVDAMYKVGKSLPYELRETALGGVAATPTACSLCNRCG